MDLHRYPDLIDRLAGEYVLGLLRGGARRRFDRLAEADPAVRAAIDVWTRRISALAELVPAVAPPASTWPAIERRLGNAATATGASIGEANPGSMRQGGAARAVPVDEKRSLRRPTLRWFESVAFWRSWSIVATGTTTLAAAIALALALRPFAPAAPHIASIPSDGSGSNGGTAAPVIERVSYVAALADVNTNKTMVFVMWDEKNAMMSAHRMTGGDAPPPGKSEQLWGIPEHGQPVSLGMLPPGRIVHMKVRGVSAFVRLAVSVEPPGGSPATSGPSGPVVCAGKLMGTA
jgi:anti-sigma-K factor RskA